jgi:hypothetical protein
MRHRWNAPMVLVLIVQFNFLLLQALSVAAVYIGGRDGRQVANTNYDFIIVGGMPRNQISQIASTECRRKIRWYCRECYRQQAHRKPSFQRSPPRGRFIVRTSRLYIICSALLIQFW